MPCLRRNWLSSSSTSSLSTGVKKLIPDDQILEQQARRVIKDRLTKEILDLFADDTQRDTDDAALPADFRQQVERVLEERPQLPWDAAVELILNPPADADSDE